MLVKMLRPLLLAPALAIAALLALAPIATAPARDSLVHFAYIEFGLTADQGLHAQIETSSEGITLEIADKHHFVTYKAQGEPTESGLKVRFGGLGLIDVAFTPTETRTEEPPKGCTGPASTSSKGIFTGTIDFTGEREYVRIETTQVEGTLDVYRELEWKCPRHKQRMHLRGASRPAAVAARRRSKVKGEPASLGVVDRRCGCLFGASSDPARRGHKSSFFGAKFEELEGMEISRVTYAEAGARTFVFDHAAGTASVRPPKPFSGTGTFKRRPHSRDLWRSTIEVPLLGADPLSVRGPSFRARLVRALPGGE
jgi:hypothetical protein